MIMLSVISKNIILVYEYVICDFKNIILVYEYVICDFKNIILVYN